MFSCRRFALLLALAGFLAAPPAFAADINADGAQKLKTLFENIITYQKTMAQMSGGAQLDYEGDVMVEPAGTYYAVTLPHVRVTYPDKSRLDIGMVSINTSPADQPGQWKMAIAIPTPLVMLDGTQTTIMKLNIGEQKAAGIWDENLENFAKLDAQYNNVTIDNSINGFTVRMPDTQIRYDFTKNADNTWSGPGFLSTKNPELTWLPGGLKAKIGELRADFSVDHYNPAALKEYKIKLNELLAAPKDNAKDKVQKPSAKNQKPGTPPPVPAADPQLQAKLADLMSDLLLKAGNGFKGEYTLSGLDITRTDPVSHAPQTAKLDKAAFGVTLDGLAADKAEIETHLGFNGLMINPLPAGYDGVLPGDANIGFSFHNIPARQLVEMVKTTVRASVDNPDMANMAGMALLFKTPAVLSQAGAVVDIKDNYISSSIYRFDMNGNARFDINAVNNVTGELKGVFKGLDQLIGKLNSVAGDPKSPAATPAKTLGDSLQQLRNLGTVQPGTEAAPVYVYNYVMTPEGKILINGKVAGGAAPPPPASLPAP